MGTTKITVVSSILDTLIKEVYKNPTLVKQKYLFHNIVDKYIKKTKIGIEAIPKYFIYPFYSFLVKKFLIICYA